MSIPSAVRHAKERAAERYGTPINRREYYSLVDKIKSGQSRIVKRMSNTRAVHEVDGMIVVYSNRIHKILTFLPPDCVEVRQLEEAK